MNNETKILIKKPNLLKGKYFDDPAFNNEIGISVTYSGVGTDAIPYVLDRNLHITDADDSFVAFNGPAMGDSTPDSDTSAFHSLLWAGVTYRVRCKVESNGSGIRFELGIGGYTDWSYVDDGIIEFDIVCAPNDDSAETPGLTIEFEDGWSGVIFWIELYESPGVFGLDTSTDIAIPLTYSIGDIREPEKRAGSLSKTILLPGTKQNSKVFAHIFEIDGEGAYDPRRKVECLIVQSGNTVFEGSLQLLKINREQDGFRDYDALTYEVCVISSFVDLFSTIGEKYLTDLDLSRYDHEFNIDNALSTGYVYEDVPGDEYVMLDGAEHLNWDLGTAVTSYRIRPYEISNTGDRVSIKTDSAHGLVVGDQVFIYGSAQVKRMRLGGYQVVHHVINSTEFIVTMGWNSLVTSLIGDTMDGDYNVVDEFSCVSMVPTGEGYCYPQIDQGNGNFGGDGLYSEYGAQIVANLRPAVYVKTLVDQMFKEANYTYSSDFFDSAFFKRLVVPGSSVFSKTEEQQNELSCRIKLSALNGFTHTTLTGNTWTEDGGSAVYGIGELLEFDTPNFDNGSPTANWDTSLHRYTLSVNSGLNVRVKGKVYHCKQNSGDVIGGVGTQLVFCVYNASDVLQWKKTLPVLAVLETTPLGGPASAVPFDVTVPYNGWGVENATMEEGWYVTVRLRAQGITNAIMLYGVTSDTTVECWPDTNIAPGSTVSLSSALPKGVKQRDLLVDLVKMFNLYLQPRRTNPRIIDIEPRDDFYLLNDRVDWTYKVDLSKNIEVIPLGDLTAKTFVYSYKEDKDSLNKLYTEGYKEVYGQSTQNVFNEFAQGEKKIELTASSTPIAGPNLYYTPNAEDNRWDRFVSCITQTNPSTLTASGGVISANYRILYWAPRTGYFSQDWHTFIGGGTPERTLYTYGYAGHLDNIWGPSYDLNFGYPREVFYNYTTWTDNNLFNRFHREEILDRSSITSKVVTGYFNLSPIDIAQLDFRKAVVFDGHLCRLNRVLDYDAVSEGQTTKVELVTVERGRTSFLPSNGVGTGVGNSGGFSDAVRGAIAVSGSTSTLADSSRNAIRNSDSSAIIGGSGNTLTGATRSVLIGTEDFDGFIDRSILIGDNPSTELQDVAYIKKDSIVLDGKTRHGANGTPFTHKLAGSILLDKTIGSTGVTIADTSGRGWTASAANSLNAAGTLEVGCSVDVTIEFDNVLPDFASSGRNVVVNCNLRSANDFSVSSPEPPTSQIARTLVCNVSYLTDSMMKITVGISEPDALYIKDSTGLEAEWIDNNVWLMFTLHVLED